MIELKGPAALGAAAGAAAAAALGAVALGRAEGGLLDETSQLLAVLGLAPLLFGLLAFLHPKPLAWLRGLGTHAPAAVAAVVTAGAFLLEEAARRTVDPYGLVVTFACVWAI